jgi:hypothetical protein
MAQHKRLPRVIRTEKLESQAARVALSAVRIA